MTQTESWVDLRVNEALKKDSDISAEEESANLDSSDCRLSKPRVQVSLLEPSSMRRKVAESIRAQL